MKKLKLCFFLGLLANSAYAQNFDLNTYKFRYQKFRGLLYNVNLGGSNSYNFSNNSDNYDLNKLVTYKTKSPGFNFDGNLSMDYFQMINTDRLQQNLSFGLFARNQRTSNKSKQSVDFDDRNSQDYSNFNKSSMQIYSAYLNLDNRLYYRGNKFYYLNVNADAFISKNSGKSESNYNGLVNGANEAGSMSSNYELGLKLGAGSGRLEYVSDAVLANFLIKDLKRKAMIGEVSDQQLMEVAKSITYIKNRRYLDMRFRVIEQIEMMDSLLQFNGISSEKKARYFTTIYDNWLYANQMARYSGKRFTYFITSQNITYENRFNLYSTELSRMKKAYNSLQSKSGIGLEFQSSKQVNLNIQKLWGIDFAANYSYAPVTNVFEDSLETPNYTRTETKQVVKNLIVDLGGQYEILYQPNTRTYLRAFVRPEMFFIKMLDEEIETVNKNISGWSYTAKLNSGLDFFRFINARVSFNANVQLNLMGYRAENIYQFNPDGTGKRSFKETQNNLGYSISLRYAIF